jgi:hypothetical protein
MALSVFDGGGSGAAFLQEKASLQQAEQAAFWLTFRHRPTDGEGCGRLLGCARGPVRLRIGRSVCGISVHRLERPLRTIGANGLRGDRP